MGDDQWREADAWPPASTATSYYLISPKPGEIHGSLSADAPREKKAFDVFSVRSGQAGGQSLQQFGRARLPGVGRAARCSDFRSAPLERDTEVTGPIHAQIYFACDCRDTDLWVRLLDVAPDGTAFNLMSPGLDVLRASYRDLKKGRQLLKPNQVYELHLDNLITSNVFRKGHRIRVQISATFFPNFSRNLQTGELEEFIGKNAEGEHFDLHRPPAAFAHCFAGRVQRYVLDESAQHAETSEESLPQRNRISLLLLLAVAFCCRFPAARAQREPVLKQIDVPHPYYFREMYLPQLTTGPSAVAWAPDSRSVVYSMAGSLWQQKLDSDVAEQLTAGPGYDYQPDCSSDGRWVVYASYAKDAVELWALNLETKARGNSRPAARSTSSPVFRPTASGSHSFPLRSTDASTFSSGNSATAN